MDSHDIFMDSKRFLFILEDSHTIFGTQKNFDGLKGTHNKIYGL